LEQAVRSLDVKEHYTLPLEKKLAILRLLVEAAFETETIYKIISDNNESRHLGEASGERHRGLCHKYSYYYHHHYITTTPSPLLQYQYSRGNVRKKQTLGSNKGRS